MSYTSVKSDFRLRVSGSPFRPPFTNVNELVNHIIGIEVVVVSVVGVGVGVGVDCYGRRVIGGLVRGMVGATTVKVLGITVTGSEASPSSSNGIFS
nr:hypothetical protein [Tanacetum cinerariifolium]